MRNWVQRHKKKIKRGLIVILVLAAALYGICFYMSYKAADIFNKTVAERQLFPGTVTVERLTATPGGTVSFENLLWVDEDGHKLVQVPEGEFTVKIRDILTGRIGTQTLETVTLNNAYLHLIFNDKMELQHIKSHPGDGEKSGKKVIEITGPKGNRPFDSHIELHHSVIEAESPYRHFTMEDVDLVADIHTKGKTDINLQAGPFSGTVAAKSLRIRGSIDFAPETPQYDLFLLLTECNPKSLGAGLDIDDPATISADIKGPLDKPVIDGILTMDKLDITTLVFTDVKGQVHYEKGILDISDVTAGVFGGSMKGQGHVNLDNKSYTADIVGTGLQAVLPPMTYFCAVMSISTFIWKKTVRPVRKPFMVIFKPVPAAIMVCLSAVFPDPLLRMGRTFTSRMSSCPCFSVTFRRMPCPSSTAKCIWGPSMSIIRMAAIVTIRDPVPTN